MSIFIPGACPNQCKAISIMRNKIREPIYETIHRIDGIVYTEEIIDICEKPQSHCKYLTTHVSYICGLKSLFHNRKQNWLRFSSKQWTKWPLGSQVRQVITFSTSEQNIKKCKKLYLLVDITSTKFSHDHWNTSNAIVG